MCVYIYIYMHMHMCTYLYIQREREKFTKDTTSRALSSSVPQQTGTLVGRASWVSNVACQCMGQDTSCFRRLGSKQ